MRSSVQTLEACVAVHRGPCWLGMLRAALGLLWVGRATRAAVAAAELLPFRLAPAGSLLLALGAGPALLQAPPDEEI